MRIVPLLLLLAVCFVLTAGKLLNETIKGTLEKETTRKGGGSDIAVALIEAGATIITSNGNPPNTWQLPSGTKINADDCWTDGGGACPNGNCLDNKGPRGIPIVTTELSCRGCFRGCRKQLCCKEQANWANVMDGDMNFECPQGHGIHKIRSE